MTSPIMNQLISYLERRLKYANADLRLGVMPGVQDSIELELMKVRTEELKTMLAFVRNLEYQYRDHDDPPQSAPASSE